MIVIKNVKLGINRKQTTRKTTLKIVMKMIQKTTWMHYSIIGISSILFFLASACASDIDYVVKADFVYYNDTNYVIHLESSETINPNDSLKIFFESDGSKNINETGYVPPYPFNEVSIIKYGESKCDFLNSGIKAGQGEGPLGIQNYEYRKLSERYYEFKYHFTEEEYNQAENCN
ncbi:hypothetical protein [Mariniflexile sp. HMF6888]|uniref:hypothetical protein n=1 Tax=Mariniflexile sp. HMF6888 TaxID=3373086 RepID=UPI00378D68B0